MAVVGAVLGCASAAPPEEPIPSPPEGVDVGPGELPAIPVVAPALDTATAGVPVLGDTVSVPVVDSTWTLRGRSGRASAWVELSRPHLSPGSCSTRCDHSWPMPTWCS
jgi:hypothetical protein